MVCASLFQIRNFLSAYVVLFNPVKQWKGCVKARHFILALREYYDEQYIMAPDKAQQWNTANAASKAGTALTSLLRTKRTEGLRDVDAWALRYLDVARIRPLIDAFDCDASGFITAKETNQFTMSPSRPSNWR